MKRLFITFLVAAFGAAFALGINNYFQKDTMIIKNTQSQPVTFASFEGSPITQLVDFTYAAEVSTPTVVHIKSTFMPRTMNRGRDNTYNPFRDFFGDDFWGYQQPFKSQPSQAFGSGVILSSDGYIVTNNHVINDADEIHVTLYDKRTFKAKLIGADPSTDIAVIKIEIDDLPFIIFGNSDQVRIGEWVLAVGNPFNFSSTVTAGIISAKGRNLHILNDNAAIESFIQTDAAVNKGNSGGALVNLRGELIGINTAIATPTGVYAGYAFSVPVNMVEKVVDDLLKFGVVQRGFMGVFIRDIDSDLAKKIKIKELKGAYVDSLMPNGAAKAAGIKKGDVILRIGNSETNSASQLQEVVARQRPGDRIEVKINRNGKIKLFNMVLKNKEGNTGLVTKNKTAILESLGAKFEEISSEERKSLDVAGGVKVKKLYDGKLKEFTYIKEGFIITKVDGRKITSISDLTASLQNKKGKVIKIEGVYKNYPGIFNYGFEM